MIIVSSLPIFYCEKQSVFFDQAEEYGLCLLFFDLVGEYGLLCCVVLQLALFLWDGEADFLAVVSAFYI